MFDYTENKPGTNLDFYVQSNHGAQGKVCMMMCTVSDCEKRYLSGSRKGMAVAVTHLF